MRQNNTSGAAWQVTITNQPGQAVYRTSFAGSHYKADLSGIAAAMYFLHISNDKGSNLVKVIKQ